MAQVYFGAILITVPPIVKGDESPQVMRLAISWADNVASAVKELHEAAKVEFPDAENVAVITDTATNILDQAERMLIERLTKVYHA